MSDNDKLYQDLERVEARIRSLGAEADTLHCPDWCSGEGYCPRCIIEDDINALYKDRAAIRQHLGLED